MEAKPLGDRIRAARLERKMTQDDLARDTFSKSYVSAVELGKIQPSIKALRILARRLQLPASHFLETLEPDRETQQAQLALARARLLIMLGGNYQESFDLLNSLDRERLTEQDSAETLFLEGCALAGLERFGEALSKLQQAQNEWADLEEPSQVEQVRNVIGELYFQQRKYILAQEQHKAGLQAIEQGVIRDPGLKLAIYANLARVYTALDLHDAARGLFEVARQCAEEAATPQTLVSSLSSLADHYEAENRLKDARLTLEQASTLMQTAATPHLATNLHMVFGLVFLAGHNWPEAETAFRAALDSNSSRLSSAIRTTAYNNLANLFLRQNRLDEALTAANQAYEALQEDRDRVWLKTSLLGNNSFTGSQLATGEVLLTLAQINEKKANHAQADHYFEAAIAQLRQSNQPEILSAAYFSYGEMLLERGDSARGAHFLKIAYEERSRQT